MPRPRTPLPDQLGDRLFTRAEALRRGVPLGVLRGPGVRSLAPGVHLAAGIEPSLAQRLSALLTVLPAGTAVDGVTALRCRGIEVADERPYRFVTTAAYQSKRPGILVRRVRRLPETAGSVVRPVPALVAAKSHLGLLDLVVAGDWLVRAKLATLADVQQGLTAATGRECVRARRAGELVRARVDSPRETRLRLVMVLSGLPEPECNVELGDEFFFIARVDLYLRAWQIAVEYEGDHHRTDARTFARDLTRYERLAAAGVLVVRVSKDHLRRPREVARRIHTALVARGYDGPGPVFGPEWCSVFGVRADRGE